MCLCTKCGKGLGSVILVAGAALLIKDLGIWTLWGITPWTLVFIIAGFALACSSCCKDCTSCCAMPKTEAKTTSKKTQKK